MTTHTLRIGYAAGSSGQPTLRVCLERDEAGSAVSLRLAKGWDQGASWRDHNGSPELVLSADILPRLQEVLAALTAR